MIVKQNGVGNFTDFCYLVGDGEAKDWLFIDPADDAEALLAEARPNSLNKTKDIVNTDFHPEPVLDSSILSRESPGR